MIQLALQGFLGTLLTIGGAGELRAASQASPAAAESPLSVSADSVRIGPEAAPWLEYRRGASELKPYLRSLVTPGGIELLRDGAPGHEHHHGLMLAYGVDDVEFWGEIYAEVPGREVGRLESTSWVDDEAGGHGLISEHVRWVDPRDGTTRLVEQRELLVRPGSAQAPMLLTWRSRLSLPQERAKAVLWGRPYFGLGLRFAEPFERVGRFFGADGAEGVVVRGDERLTAARWCAYTAEVDGHPVTVAMLDHPHNPRHPARFFTMAEPFAYLSATLDLAERPLELEAGTGLDLSWGLAVWEARTAPEEIDALYRAWVSRVESSGAPAAPGPPPSKGD